MLTANDAVALNGTALYETSQTNGDDGRSESEKAHQERLQRAEAAMKAFERRQANKHGTISSSALSPSAQQKSGEIKGKSEERLQPHRQTDISSEDELATSPLLEAQSFDGGQKEHASSQPSLEPLPPPAQKATLAKAQSVHEEPPGDAESDASSDTSDDSNDDTTSTEDESVKGSSEESEAVDDANSGKSASDGVAKADSKGDDASLVESSSSTSSDENDKDDEEEDEIEMTQVGPSPIISQPSQSTSASKFGWLSSTFGLGGQGSQQHQQQQQPSSPALPLSAGTGEHKDSPSQGSTNSHPSQRPRTPNGIPRLSQLDRKRLFVPRPSSSQPSTPSGQAQRGGPFTPHQQQQQNGKNTSDDDGSDSGSSSGSDSDSDADSDAEQSMSTAKGKGAPSSLPAHKLAGQHAEPSKTRKAKPSMLAKMGARS